MLVPVILMAMTETPSTLPIMPLLSVIGISDVIYRKNWLQNICNYFDFQALHDFIVALGIASLTLVIASSALKTAVARLTGNEASGADQRPEEVARTDLSRARYRDNAVQST